MLRCLGAGFFPADPLSKGAGALRKSLRAGDLRCNDVGLLHRKANPLGKWMNKIAQKLMLDTFIDFSPTRYLPKLESQIN